MSNQETIERLDGLIRRCLRVPEGSQLDDDTGVATLAADWRVIDLGIMVEAEFGISMSADEALALKTVGDWRRLVTTGLDPD